MIRQAAVEKAPATCPECGGDVVASRDAEVCCTDCALVLTDTPVDHGPDWRKFDDDSNPARAQELDHTRHDDGFSTEIGFEIQGAGESLTRRQRNQLVRMRREHNRSQYRSHRERNEKDVLMQLRRLAGRLSASKAVLNTAARIARRDRADNSWHGVSLERITAAAYYAGVRVEGEPVRPQQIAAVSRGVPVGEITTGAHRMRAEQNLSFSVVSAADYVPQVASACDTPARARTAAAALAAAGDELPTDHSPSAIAAAAVYVVHQRVPHPPALTQSAVADAVGRTPHAIRNTRDTMADAGLLAGDRGTQAWEPDELYEAGR